MLLYKVVNIDWSYETMVARDRALAKRQEQQNGNGSEGNETKESEELRAATDDEEEVDARRGLLDEAAEKSEEQSWVRLGPWLSVQCVLQLMRVCWCYLF